MKIKTKKAEAWGIVNPEGELYPNAFPIEYMAKDFINGNKGFKPVKVRILLSSRRNNGQDK